MKLNPLHTDVFLTSFANDPLFNLVFADDDENKTKRAQQWYFDSMLAYCARHGGVIATPDNMGVITWIGAKHFPPHFDADIQQTIDDEIAEKINKFEKHETMLENYIAENGHNYGYICLLAVHPQARKQGYAANLLATAMQQMKADGLEACWLSTENPDNRIMYSKNGFTLVKEFVTPVNLDAYIFMQNLK